MTTRRLGAVGRVVLGTFAVGALAVVTFVCGLFVDRISDVAVGQRVRARADTTEVAPGDDIVLWLWTQGRPYRLRARFDAGEAFEVWQSTGKPAPSQFAISIPESAPLGELKITFDVQQQIKTIVERKGFTDYYRMDDRQEEVTVAVELVSPEVRNARRWKLRARAGVAWVVVLGLAYALARWPFRRLSAKVRRKRKSNEDELAVAWAIVLGLGFSAVGHLAFVQPIQRTVVLSWWLPTLLVSAVWAVAVVFALWRGLLARTQLEPPPLWDSARVRAVVGTARETGYREIASTLPSMLSRDAPRCSAASISEIFRALGCDVVEDRRTFEICVEGDPILRIRARRDGPWTPEDLALLVREGIDATPLVAELAKLFGPLEYRAGGRPPRIVEHRS